MKMTEIEFSNKIAQSLACDNYLVKTEVDSGYGRADVVALKINITQIKKRLDYGQNNTILSQGFFKVLSALGETADSAMTLEEIYSKVSLSNPYIKNIVLEQLIDQNFVKKLENKLYMKVNGWAPLSNDIIAIESKLSDWKRGLVQARRYKIFANKVYLALPECKTPLVSRDILKRQNIGLVTLDQNSNLKWLYQPIRQKKEIISYKQDYVCEYFWDGMKTQLI